MTSSRVPSPEATGGAGTAFEARAGAIALSRLLRGDRVAGLDAPPTRVRLQQRVAGAVLDDIVFDAPDPRGGTQTVEYQVKRTLSVTAGDSNFVEIVGHCFGELERDSGPIVHGRRRFGIASRSTPELAQLDRVVRTARAHDTAEGFLQVVRTSAARKVRERLVALRSRVAAALPDEETDAVVDNATWRLARSLHVWRLDAEPDTEDVRAALDRLADLLPEGGDAGKVFSTLTDLVEAWAPHAGSIDVPMVRGRLEQRGIALNDAPARRRAFDKLQDASQHLLDPAAARLGRRLHLPRRALRRDVRSAIEEHHVLVLAGRAGVGKSITARLVAHDLAEEGTAVVVVNLAGRSGPLALLEQELGTSLAEALRGAPIGGLRVLVLDGAEQALTDGGQLLGAVLDAVPVEPGHAPPWRVALTARDEAVSTLTRLVEDRSGSKPQVFTVGELGDDEVAQIVDEFRRLAPLERNPRARALLLRRPYLVELLVRAVDTLDLPHDVAGEEDVLAIVNERLIRLDQGGLPGRGAPYARADIFIELGEAMVTNDLPARLDGTDPEARAGLVSDDIITEVRSSWRFAHDILAEYAAATRLLEPDGPDRLAASSTPRRLLRSARLRLQRELADALAAGRFTEVWRDERRHADDLAEADGPRWSDVPWEALLHLGAARTALAHLAGELFANDAVLLLRLIDVTGRLARRPAPSQAGQLGPLDVTLSAPVVDLLLAHATEVPDSATVAALHLVHEHLAAAASADVGGQLEHFAKIPDTVIRWAGGDPWGARLEQAIGALAFCGDVLQDQHETYLVAHARARPDELAEVVEGQPASRHLATTRPDLLLRLAGLYYLGRGLTLTGEDETPGDRPGRRRSYSRHEDGEGVRDHSPEHSRHLDMWPLGNDQSNPALGPFRSLLDTSPRHALRLIGAVVDTATTARAQLEASFRDSGTGGDESLDLELSSPDWPQPLSFTGPATVWMWHRRTSVGPGPALSALMALRAWAVARIRDGEPARRVRDTLLSTGTSLAFVSVALSVLVDRIDDIDDELDPFLTHPLLWHLEIARATHEQTGLALEIPEAPHLSWTLSNVAVLLALRADDDRRQRLRELGDELVTNHAELRDSDSELVAQRWAAELDAERFVAEPHEGGVVISVDYPPGVVETLQDRGGAAAVRWLRLSGVITKAVQIRDGQGDLADAAELWADAVAACEEQAAASDDHSIYNAGDVLSAAGAALVLATAAGHDADDTELRRAVAFLLEGAAYFDQSAPPETIDDGDASNGRRSYVSDTVWPMGADRSIATALPALLLNGQLRQRADVTQVTIAKALEEVATSPYDEARARLVTELLPAWDLSCDPGSHAHRAAFQVARRMIATEGMTPTSRSHGYTSVMLPEPLEETILTSTGNDIDLPGASFGVALAAGSRCDCYHGRAARALVDVLIDYDHRVWPAEYARHGYHRYEMWRNAIDAVIADRVMSGDDAVLDMHLNAFAPIGEELRGFLQALVARAVDTATVTRLHDIWPRILDRLLPDARDLESRDGDHERRRPYHRYVEDLDRALLLIPPSDGDWPVERTFRLGARWLAAYQARPHVADRAIMFVGRTLSLGNDVAIQVILTVLGDNIDMIRRSQYAVAWLQAVLSNPPPGRAATRARTLLDRLAAAGDDWALTVQQQLEA